MPRFREIYADTGDGGVQLGASADRWHLYEDFVHLSPHHTEGKLVRFEAELLPFVDNLDRGALVVVDMQNDFCSPGGWTQRSGLDHEACRAAIPGVQRAVEAARRHGMFVIWVYWHNRPDLRNLGAPTLYSFKHRLDQRGIGEELDLGQVLTAGSWGARMVDELQDHIDEDDIRVEKVRMSGFYGTHLDQVLRTQGIQTLFVCGVNADQCVSTTLEDAYFRDYNPVLISDATATSSPAYCKDAVVFNTKQCWGFVTTTDGFANPRPYPLKGLT
ncbi:cysteine hydrolase family protein [Micromonospora halophytica]|uniref:Nicotinamidase-related amidase n=1 Tax=Micromonospora halophytica TaxID=47864 RepID=A0A1C5GXH8_9ACTN|nr:isochorismatase family cysteine hydrolase [Micromonospora halophytica]SCG37851.1 Nicotinamidase-related amidase [Micromonospora halophytica]